MRFAPLLALCAVQACAGASHELVSPGTYAISCKRSQSNCWKEASKVCPNGFDQLAANGRQGYASNLATGEQMTNVPTYDGEMLVKCR